MLTCQWITFLFVSTYNFEGSTFCIIDIITQLEKITGRNVKYIKKSRSDCCEWRISADNFTANEIQLVLNVDGAPVFKSTKLSVWPVLVQLFNLLPKLRSSFHNMCLLGLWHGISKPNFDRFLEILSNELDTVAQKTLSVSSGIKIKFRALVCDMPAKAYVLCMKQHNGYNSCPRCFIKGFSQNRRMLFKVSKSFVFRETESFKKCGLLADCRKTVWYGVKSYTPLHKFFELPWGCPVDPMHQVFSRNWESFDYNDFITSKKKEQVRVEHLILSCQVPLEILHRPKKFAELQFWKAYDFKLFFLHLGLLVLQDAAVPEGYLESFAALSFAIRLLSESSVSTNQIQQAEFLIEKFFDNFLTLYDSDSQSFNFHTMRHLVEQVKRNEPLWQFSAFGFESANHNLLSAVSGTIKNPQNIAERFLRHQSAFESHFYKTSTSNKTYLTTFTVIPDNITSFCSVYNIEFYFGRFVNNRGTRFGSMSYTRSSLNLGEFIVRLKNNEFVRIEAYAMMDKSPVAIVRTFQMCREISFLGPSIEYSFNYTFEIGDLGALELLAVESLCFKTVVLQNSSTFSVSVIREGFEHN